MRRDYIELSCTPNKEDCQQVGTENYDPVKAREECRRFVAQLERRFPKPGNVFGYFGIKANPHDFGTYLDVVAYFDADDERSVDWAFFCENNLPNKWTDEEVLHAVAS